MTGTFGGRERALLALAMLCTMLGCGKRPAPQSTANAPAPAVDVASDTALGAPRPMRDFAPFPAGPVRVSVVRVAPARAGLSAALPTPEAATPEPHDSPPAAGALESDDDLRAPIARTGAAIDRARARRGWVELDVRVDENGEVSDALFAEGEADSVTIEAAIDAALAMRFYPAVQAGRPVAVWCRQRFDLRR